MRSLSIALAAGALASGHLAPRAVGSGRMLLPDLVQEVPSQLQVERPSGSGAPRFHLRFRAAVFNGGVGPLMIVGRRATRAALTMSVSQVVMLADGRTRTYTGAGAMRFDAEATHGHWHYLDFERYALVRAAPKRTVATSHKAGFCLGDRYRISSSVTTFPAFLLVNCDYGRPNVLSTGAGISAGFGDDYRANRAGQYIDVTRLQAGNYALINEVNPRRLLRERSYENDAASLLLALSWPGGQARAPVIAVRRICPAGTPQIPCGVRWS